MNVLVRKGLDLVAFPSEVDHERNLTCIDVSNNMITV